jgi:glycosyltransferase involved in cell wall biosynthesis
LHHLYRACHIYVSPSYAESFAHPLIESMSSGLPVVASDLPVHREICGDAALYFSRFSPEELAEKVMQIQASPELAKRLSDNGLRRAQDFSWNQHVERLVALAHDLVRTVGEPS